MYNEGKRTVISNNLSGLFYISRLSVLDLINKSSRPFRELVGFHYNIPGHNKIYSLPK